MSVSLLYVVTLNLTWFTATDIILLNYKPVTEGRRRGLIRLRMNFNRL